MLRKGNAKYLIIIALLVLSCAQVKQDDPLMNPAHETWTTQAPEESLIRIETSKGFFVIALHRSWSPIGVDRFYNLVRLGYYDDSRFYRVRENFIAQFGIAGNPKVAQVWEKETIADDPVVQKQLARLHLLCHDSARHTHYAIVFQPKRQ